MTPRTLNYESGRPEDVERSAWQDRFNLTEKKREKLTDALMMQLCLCRSDEARRSLLGVSR